MREYVPHYECDAYGHVNHASYVVYLADAVVRVCEAGDWPMTRMMEAGFGIVARR